MTDRELLRALASEWAEIAALPVQKQNEKLYRALNGLKMIRPVVLLDELPWNQLNGAGELTLHCEDEFLRGVERVFRRTLYRWRHCRGDMIVQPFFDLQRHINIGDKGVTIHEYTLEADKGNNIVSHHYIDQLATLEDLEKLHVPEITVDDAATQREYELLNGIFGDILPIRVCGAYFSGFMPWDELAMWRGVQPIYEDLYDNPELLHATVRKLTDIQKAMLDKMEQMNLIDAFQPVIHCTAGYAPELPGEIENGRVTRKNIWGRGTAQMFSEVSPKMHDEFDIQYEKEYFEGFGLVYYGCCEPLDKKIDIVKQLPNLRKLSITPWANVRASAEQMGADYVLSRKPNPATVAVPVLDTEALRRDILDTLTACRDNGTPCEFILKDISSVHNNPENLTRWEQTVCETVKNF